jgi:hypothetical protein
MHTIIPGVPGIIEVQNAEGVITSTPAVAVISSIPPV